MTDKRVSLTEWELARMAQMSSSNALTYMGHHNNAGLKPHEIEEMNRWIALSKKLSEAQKSPRIVNITVKPLEWTSTPPDYFFVEEEVPGSLWALSGIGGHYHIEPSGSEFLLWMVDDPFHHITFPDSESAKEAAQADHRDRVVAIVEEA